MSIPPARVAAGRGAYIGVFWFSGLNGDQAANAVTRELLHTGFNVVDNAKFNQTMHRLGIHPAHMNRDALRKLQAETGANYMLVGSCVSLPGILDFSHAGMAAHLVDMEESKVIWSEKHGNSIFTGVFGTSNEVDLGASKLVQSLDKQWGEHIRSQEPKSRAPRR